MQHRYPRSIKTALNRRAHAEGRAYAEAVKARLMADLERLKASGASHAAMLAVIEGMGGLPSSRPQER